MRKNALIIVSVLLFLSISLLLIKVSNPTYALEEKNIPKEETLKEQETPEKETTQSKENVNIDLINIDSSSENMTMQNTDFVIPEDLLNDLNNTLQSYAYNSSFLVVSLKDSMTFGYKIDETYNAASTIKAAYALYLYKLASDNKINLDEMLTYEAKFYNKGTGNIKNSPYGTTFKVHDLIQNMLIESDNVAYLMLLNRYKWEDFNEMLDNLGTPEAHLSNTSRWGKISARSMGIIWQEIYRFKDENIYGKELFDLLLNAKYNYFKEVLPNIPSASKSGFTDKVVHDTGIIMEENNPYIVIILTNANGNQNDAYNHVKNVLFKINPIIQSYQNFIY